MPTYMIVGLPYSTELYHHGIKGQKWGVRNYQLENGTLTPAGRERYATSIKKSIENARHNPETKAKLKKAAKIAAITAGTALAAYGTYRLAKSGALSDVASSLSNKVTRLNADPHGGSDRMYKTHKSARAERRAERANRIKKAAFSFNMSDSELDAFIGRLEKEKRLNDLLYETLSSPGDPKKRVLINSGRKVAETVLAGAGVYTIKALLTKKISPKDAADYLAPKPKKK